MNKLNLWCWNDIKHWYTNVDIIPWEGVDKVFDFETIPYPFEDNTFDEIYCSMVMEHIHNLPDMISEIVRISKNDGLLKIIVPYHSSPNLWWDITHVRGFNLNSFSWFHVNSLKNHGWSGFFLLKQKIHYLSNKKFMESSIINIVPDFFINLFPKIYERFFSFICPSSEIHYLIKVIK